MFTVSKASSPKSVHDLTDAESASTHSLAQKCSKEPSPKEVSISVQSGMLRANFGVLVRCLQTLDPIVFIINHSFPLFLF